jgi:tetratricopeptide (TPR) repeat protein
MEYGARPASVLAGLACVAGTLPVAAEGALAYDFWLAKLSGDVPVIKPSFISVAAIFWLVSIWSAPLAAQGLQVEVCGALQNPYGPFDYRDLGIRREYLPRVEQHHFTLQVRTLEQGKSSTLIGDIDYTLRAFPNHPAALDTVARYALRGGKFLPDGIPTADCYFERAVSFAIDDPAVRVLYGNYLLKRGQKDAARAHYEHALEVAPESPDVNYNAGLFYLELGDLNRAKELAKVAYELGYPLPGLRNKIEVAEAKATRK